MATTRKTDHGSTLSIELLEERTLPAYGLDPTFGTAGVASNVLGPNRLGTSSVLSTPQVAVGAGGAVFVAADSPEKLSLLAQGDIVVGRTTATGAIDSSFGTNGQVRLSLSAQHDVTALAALPNGGLLIAGGVDQSLGMDGFVIRLTPSGSVDPTFGNSGEADIEFGGQFNFIRSMAVLADGKILLSGTTMNPTGGSADLTQLAEAQLTAAGHLDGGFGAGGIAVDSMASGATPVTAALAIQPDGNVVEGTFLPTPPAAGEATDPEMQLSLARFKSDGSPDSAFGSGGQTSTSYGSGGPNFGYIVPSAVASLGNGDFVAAGDSPVTGQALLAWFQPNGTLISQEVFPNAASRLSTISQLIPLPQGGVEAIGTAAGQYNGFAAEYHAAPGSASGFFEDNAAAEFTSPIAAAAGPGASIIVAQGVPYQYQATAQPGQVAPALDAFRLVDPGITSSASTFVDMPGNPSPPSGPVTLEASVLPQLGDPTAVADGTLTLLDGSTVLGTVSMSSLAGQASPTTIASIVVDSLTPGDHVITAQYSGSAHWTGSSATTTVHIVSPLQVSVQLNDAIPVLGDPMNLVASIASADGSPPVDVSGGMVSFFDGTSLLGTATVGPDGKAVLVGLNAILQSAGIHDFKATYDGGPLSGPVSSPDTRIDINPAPTATQLTVAPMAAVAGSPITLTASVGVLTNPYIVPDGTVAFYDGTTLIGSAQLTQSGGTSSGAISTTLRLGRHSLHAVYNPGQNTMASSSPTIQLTVAPAPTATTLAASAATISPAHPLTLTATVKPVVGAAFPVGTVRFLDGANLLGTGTLDGRGHATLTLTNLHGGVHSITAVYSGCSTCLGSTSSAVSVTGGSTAPAPTTTTLSASTASPVFGQYLVLTAGVAAASGPVNGTVNFYDGSNLVATGLLTQGSTTFTYRFNLGSHKFWASYVGNSTDAGSTSATLRELVTQAPTSVILKAGPTNETLTATVVPAFTGSPIGTVAFMDGTTVLGTAAVNGSGVAFFTLTAPLSGKDQIVAVYSGCSCFLGSTSNELSLIPQP
jgi:uncharacterized delta-60 repeat protein